MSDLPDSVVLHADVVYARYGARALTMDILRPRGVAPDRRLPAILHVHGGGWKVRDRKALTSDLVRVAERGYVAATMRYRLSPEATFPAQIQDVTCAVRFLRHHADRFAIAGERIGAWGYSAGGHLVALLAVAGGVEAFQGEGGWSGSDSRVQAACACCGIADLAAYAPGGNEADPDHPDHYAGLLLGGPIRERRDEARRASPITWASAAAAPLLLVHGDQDDGVRIDQARRLHRALSAAGAASELHELRGVGHEFGGPEVDRVVDAFFDRRLRPETV